MIPRSGRTPFLRSRVAALKKEVMKRDKKVVPKAVARFIRRFDSLPRPPKNMYSSLRHKRFAKLVKEARCRNLNWCRAVPGRSVEQGDTSKHYPRVALKKHGVVCGYDLLRIETHLREGSDWKSEVPCLMDPDGVVPTTGLLAMFPFMVKALLESQATIGIDLHVISQGWRDFNAGKRPMMFNPYSQKKEELICYVHSDFNLTDYVREFLDSHAFNSAMEQPGQSDTVKRIVFTIMLCGHAELIGLDRTYDSNADPVADLLFVMTSMPASAFTIDKDVSEKIVLELKRQMTARGLLLPNCSMMDYPAAGLKLREISRMPEFEDMACGLLSVLYSLYLAMVKGVEHDCNPAFANKKVWNTFRTFYHQFEERLLTFLETQNGLENVVLLSPSMGECFVNINNAALVVHSTTGNRRSTWGYRCDTGWTPRA